MRPFGKGLRLNTLERAVHGIDLGPLEPCLPDRLKTEKRRIELAPAPFVDDSRRLLATLDGDPVDPPGGNCECRADGSCDPEDSGNGPICDYQLWLRADPGNMPPSWDIEECGGGTGWQVACDGWQKSSWGKPELGAGLPPDCPRLPAYQATARVPYWWSLGRSWDEWEVVDPNCECECHGGAERPPGVRGCSMSGCDGPDVHTEEHCDPLYGWVEKGPNWVLLDLTHYGHPTPYMDNFLVQQVARPPCEVSPPVGALYIPCIEVQAPIEKWP